ncbi:MAG: hypothetical protein ABR985_17415 [Methanotrichaceae archaeon]
MLGIKRHLQVDTKASPLLRQLVVAAATTDASKLEITARSPLIEPELILIFQAFLEMREWKFFPPAILHEGNPKYATDI